MRYAPFIALLLIASACNNTPKENPDGKAPDTVLTESPEALEAAAQAGSINDFAASYEGSINDKYAIVMQLVKTGSNLLGNYSYKNKGIAIQLYGTIAEDGSAELSEMSKGTVTGLFTGRISEGSFSGTWSKEDKSGSMPFKVTQTSIASMQTKADVLSYAIGTYSLRSISGVAGANTMFDTYQENGKWVSSSSGNIGGQREGSTNELSKKDVDLLDNMRIVVDDAMNVHFYAGLVELFNSPFKAKGMDYRTSGDKTQLSERLAALSPDTIRYNNKYILLAKDQVNFSQALKGDFGVVTEDNLILTYIPGNNTFELEFFLGSCCDSNVLTFTKK